MHPQVTGSLLNLGLRTHTPVTPMTQDLYRTARQAGLPPLTARIAAIVADVEGPQRARGFITGVREEDDRRASLAAAHPVVEVISPVRDSARVPAEPVTAGPLPVA
jgi:hypothetical protein